MNDEKKDEPVAEMNDAYDKNVAIKEKFKKLLKDSSHVYQIGKKLWARGYKKLT